MRVVKGGSAPKLTSPNERGRAKKDSGNLRFSDLKLELRKQTLRHKFWTEKQKGNLPTFFQFKLQELEVTFKIASVLSVV